MIKLSVMMLRTSFIKEFPAVSFISTKVWGMGRLKKLRIFMTEYWIFANPISPTKAGYVSMHVKTIEYMLQTEMLIINPE